MTYSVLKVPLNPNQPTNRVVCICLSVCHSSEPCKNGWTDRDTVWDGFTCVDPRNDVLDGVLIPMEMGNFEGERGDPF